MPETMPTNVQFLTIEPEELLGSAEKRARFNESMDLAEAAALVRSMRQNARNPDGTFGITQEGLARRIGVSQARISHIEHAEGRDGPSFTLLKRIARACDVDWPVNEIKPRSAAEQHSRETSPERPDPLVVLREEIDKLFEKFERLAQSEGEGKSVGDPDTRQTIAQELHSFASKIVETD